MVIEDNNMDIGSVLKNFRTLNEFNEFLAEIADKGHEVSRGMDPNDKSKSQKDDQQRPAMDEQESAGPETETVAGAEAPAPEGVTIDPVAAPGSQVAIGKKVKSDIHEKPKTKAVSVSGSEKTKVDTKPNVVIDDKHRMG